MKTTITTTCKGQYFESNILQTITIKMVKGNFCTYPYKIQMENEEERNKNSNATL